LEYYLPNGIKDIGEISDLALLQLAENPLNVTGITP